MACTLIRRLFRRRWRGSVAFTTPALLPQQASIATSASCAPNATNDALESLYLLNNMAGQGSHQLIVSHFPDHLDTEELVLKYSAHPGYLNACAFPRENNTFDVVIDFATASDAAMALVNCPSVTFSDRTFVPINEDAHTYTESEDTQSRKKMKTTHEMPIEKPKCRICSENLSGPYAKPCLQCKAAWCYDCLQRWFKTALDNQSMFPARCCDKVIHYDTVRGILATSEYNKYKMRYEEFSIPKPIYCASAKCSAFLTPRLVQQDADKRMSCYACGTQTCSECRNIIDSVVDHQCPTTDATAKMLDKYDYKRCPRCNGGVAHMYGCPHVRCQCGAHWCWDCQRPIKMCWRNPCTRSREDGNQTEDDIEPEPESDVNTESGETAENSISPEDNGQTTHQPEQQAEDVTVVITETETSALQHEGVAPDIVVTEPPPHNANTTSHEATPRDVDAQTAIISPQPNGNQEESATNLDASDFDDWEGGDFDFGEEPQDESWDTWGCIHRLQGLPPHKVPEFWLPNKAHEVDCMNCFKATAFRNPPKREKTEKEAEDAVLRGRARTVPWLNDQPGSEESKDRPNSAASTVVGSCVSDATSTATIAASRAMNQHTYTAPDTSAGIASQVDLPRLNEPSACIESKFEQVAAMLAARPKIYNCTICGVIYCTKCKKSVTKAINTQLKRK